MSLSLIGKSISPSATLRLNATSAALKAKGEPIIHLGGGEPTSKAPMEALLTAAALLSTGEIRYTPADGIAPLKKAIVNYTEQYYNKQVAPENIIASGGAKQALMIAMQAILDPLDEIIYPAPYWVSYPEMAKLCGAVGVPVYPKDGSFYPSIQDIEKAVTPKTKCVIINSPNNPSGAMYSELFISDVVNFCESKDLYLIMDDIYHRLIFDGREIISCYKFEKTPLETSKIVVINGVSKAYAMTGFRIGWAVASKEVLGVMSRIQAQQCSGPSVLTQTAAVGALNSDQSSVESLKTTLENNRNVLIERLKSFEGVIAPVPEGAFYCFPNFAAYADRFDNNSSKLAQYLLDKVLVTTVPGIEFGMKEGCYLRLSTCGNTQDIVNGLERIKWALDPNSPNEFLIGNRRITKD